MFEVFEGFTGTSRLSVVQCRSTVLEELDSKVILICAVVDLSRHINSNFEQKGYSQQQGCHY